MVKILDWDSIFRSAIPLTENAVKIRARCIFPSQSPANIRYCFFIDSFFEGQRFIKLVFLPLTDEFFETLSWSSPIILRQSSSLIWIGGDVALSCLVCHLCGRRRVITGEDLVRPFGFFQLLSLFVCYKNGRLGFLALSVIKLQSRVLFWIIHWDASSLLKSMFAHCADICKLHGRVETILGGLVSLRAVVDVWKTTLVRALFSYVHLYLSYLRL